MRKKAPKQQPTAPKEMPTLQQQDLPIELQQLILNIFRNSFPAAVDFEELKPVLKEVNDALLEDDLETAFGNEERREGYAVRWSPSRSLAYSNVLAWICEQKPEEDWVKRILESTQGTATVVCFGGGAAETMALAGLLRHLRPQTAGRPQHLETSEAADPEAEALSLSEAPKPMLNIRLVDSADWSSVVLKLETGSSTRPTLSKYASATARANNTALLSPRSFGVSFHRSDILSLKTGELQTMIGTEPVMVTFLLTLNDLYKTSIPKTTAFLRKLDAALPRDSLLLVVDSIGASAETAVINEEGQATEEKQSYPMDWLLERVLLGNPQKKTEDEEEEEEVKRWERVMQDKNRLHKLDDKLRYPGSLENMKFQMHLFRSL